jgi:hypothetical protein
VATATPGQTGWVTVDVTSAVGKWLNGAWENNGLSLRLPKHPYTGGSYPVEANLVASDNMVAITARPRLILALEGEAKPQSYTVAESNTDSAALMAAATNKPVLLCFLSAQSLTSRDVESKLLNGNADVKAYLEKNFAAVARFDANNPKHKMILKKYALRAFPAFVVMHVGKSGRESFERLEPQSFYNYESGYVYSDLDSAALFTGMLNPVLERIGGERKDLSHVFTADGQLVDAPPDAKECN